MSRSTTLPARPASGFGRGTGRQSRLSAPRLASAPESSLDTNASYTRVSQRNLMTSGFLLVPPGSPNKIKHLHELFGFNNFPRNRNREAHGKHAVLVWAAL